jgi:hypothetical protein
MKLTMEQKREIEAAFHKHPDLIKITREVFGDETLKGSSKEGKAVRDYLLEKGLRYKTTKHKKVEPVSLSDEQKEEVEEKAEQGVSSYQIARVLFPDREVKKLGMEQRAVMAHLKSINPDLDGPKAGAISEYSAPNAPSRIVMKINQATGGEIDHKKMPRQIEACVQKLGVRLNNSRFLAIINNYEDIKKRELFEQEFIRLTWDKPDLTADEVNLYMNVCKEYIHMEIISKHLEKLNKEFESIENQTDMTMRLSELIKTKSDEYHKCENRIASLTTTLQGKRGERMKRQHRDNASILAVVQMFQDEKERKNMIRIAQIQKEAIAGEADRLENMDVMMARILGVEKDDLI